MIVSNFHLSSISPGLISYLLQTNARLDQYADPSGSSDAWNKTTSGGTTIKSALDFAMTISARTSGETSYASELYPNVAAVASVYGDPEGRYLAYLKMADPTFITQPYMLWDQPFAEAEKGGLPPAQTNKGAASAASTSGTKGKASATPASSSGVLSKSSWTGGSLLSSALVFGSVLFMTLC